MWIVSVFFISIITLFIAWSCYKKSLLDSYRDDLFDLREGVRETFIKNGWGLDSVEYRRIRDLINCAIRYAEGKTLFSVMRANKIIKKNEFVSKSLNKFKKEMLSSDNTEIEKFLNKTYHSLSDSIFLYLLLSNVFVASLCFLILLVGIILAPIATIRKPKPNMKDQQMDYFFRMASESNSIQPQAA